MQKAEENPGLRTGPLRSSKPVIALAAVAIALYAVGETATSKRAVWEAAIPVRAGAGGYEAERDTWVRTTRRFEQVAERSGQEWNVRVAGDARPIMRRLRLESLGQVIDSPFLVSDKNYDFRSVPELVASITRKARTDEEKALAIRELLIGEGFYFHFISPPTPDPIHRLTNVGYGFCGHHAQIVDQLAQAAGLRSSVCTHSFGYGHASNQIFYDGQWHFIDSNAEAIFRRPDGVIPSYEEIRNNPKLVPAGDAYGQTSFGIDGVRYARALYSADTRCHERRLASDLRYGTLNYSLRPGESILWEWQDADFQRNRANDLPVYGTGKIEYWPKLADFTEPAGRNIEAVTNGFRLAGTAPAGRLQMQVWTAYPVLEVRLSARVEGSTEQVKARISKDQGKTWLPLRPEMTSVRTTWRMEIPDPDNWQEPPDTETVLATSRTLPARRYGYLLELEMQRGSGSTPLLDSLQLVTVFRQYPPALPFLKVGENRLTYVDGHGTQGKVRITLEWEERKRAPDLSTHATDWGWGETIPLSQPNMQAALPALTAGPAGTLHAVYSVGVSGSRRLAYREFRDGHWRAERLLTPTGQDANHPEVAQDGAGTVWVAYQTGGLWEGGDVWVASVKGEKLSAPVRMNTTDPFHVAFFPSISAHQQSVTVAWEGGQIDKDRNTAWGTEVGWIRSFDGKAWGPPTLVKGKPFINLGLPKVRHDSRGRLHLTATKGPRYYTTLSDSLTAAQWLTPEWMYHSRGGTLSSDKEGNLWTAFDGQNSGTTNEIYVRMLPASAATTDIENWTKALRVSEDDKRPSIYPDILTDSPARVAILWMDYRHKNAEVYAKLFTGGRWSPDLLISKPAEAQARKAAEAMTPNQILWAKPEGLQSEYPRLAQASDKTIWAVWQESVDGKPVHVMARPLLLSRTTVRNHAEVNH